MNGSLGTPDIDAGCMAGNFSWKDENETARSAFTTIYFEALDSIYKITFCKFSAHATSAAISSIYIVLIVKRSTHVTSTSTHPELPLLGAPSSTGNSHPVDSINCKARWQILLTTI